MFPLMTKNRLIVQGSLLNWYENEKGLKKASKPDWIIKWDGRLNTGHESHAILPPKHLSFSILFPHSHDSHTDSASRKVQLVYQKYHRRIISLKMQEQLSIQSKSLNEDSSTCHLTLMRASPLSNHLSPKWPFWTYRGTLCKVFPE